MAKRGNGEGNIGRTKDGRWVARFFVETPSGKNRKAIYARTRLEAATMMAHAIAQRDGRSPFDFDADKLTLSDYLDRWLASKRHEIAPSTLRVYERICRLKIKPVLGNVLMRDMRPAHVEAFKAGLLDEELAPSTISHAMDVLSGALGRAVSWEVAQTNAASRISRSKERGKRMRSLSEDEARRLVEAARGTPREALYLIALKLGPRQGELRALRWSDLDLDATSPFVSIERSVSTQHGVEWGPTKTGETRRVQLPMSLVEALRRHHKAQLETRMMAGSRGWEDPTLVFANARGALLRHQTMWRQLARDRKSAGLSHFRFHDLRHTAATLMLAAGTPVNVVSHVLDHADPAMTLRRYAHALPDMQDVAAKAMDGYAF